MEEYALTVYSLLLIGNQIQSQANLEELSRLGAAAGLLSGNNEGYNKIMSMYRLAANNLADELDNEGDPDGMDKLKLMFQ